MLESAQAAAPVERIANPAAPLAETPQATRRRRLLRGLLTFLAPPAAALVIWLLTLPASAAVVLEYFNVVASSSAVLLEWSTLSEYNVRGFEVHSRLEGGAETSFNRIGFVNPKGNASAGAQYDMLVTSLQPGRTYCFRLVEVTTDETPGEVRERCGYGLGISPTPTLRATTAPTTTTGFTPTIVLFPTATPPFGIVPTLDPFGTPAFPAPQSPLATPFGGAATDPSPDAAQAGTSIFDPFATPTTDPFAAAFPTTDPFATPTIDPFATATWTPDPFATPTPDPFATPTWTPELVLVATATPHDFAADAAAQTPTPDPAAPGDDGSAAAFPSPTPTSLYEIQTATPAPPVALPASVVTPWPTVTPPASLLQDILAPTAQNITVLLLCFIFLSATLLGGLGLITSVLWMRARSQRDLDELRRRARTRP